MVIYAWLNALTIVIAVLILILLVLWLFRRNARKYLSHQNECNSSYQGHPQACRQAPMTQIFIVVDPEEIPQLLYGPKTVRTHGVFKSTEHGVQSVGEYRPKPGSKRGSQKKAKSIIENKCPQGVDVVPQKTIIQIGVAQEKDSESQKGNRTVIQHEAPQAVRRVSHNGNETIIELERSIGLKSGLQNIDETDIKHGEIGDSERAAGAMMVRKTGNVGAGAMVATNDDAVREYVSSVVSNTLENQMGKPPPYPGK